MSGNCAIAVTELAMSTAIYSKKIFKPSAPDKGSFPLDHEGLCKKFMLTYMRCVLEKDGNTSLCRQPAKDYLECRMENELMAPEEWSKLGFTGESTSS